MVSLIFNTSEATQAWGNQLAHILKGGDVLALVGDLGSGKTTLVQGIAAGWGYKRRANSPTFALVNEYASRRGPLLHMDMYRLSRDELGAFPLEDYLDRNTVCLIEWADRIQPRWPAETLEIHLQTLSSVTRRVKIVSTSKTWQKRLARLLR